MKLDPGSNLLLKGRVGSHAFGLAHEGSDEDFQGIFVAPTEAFLGLSNTPQESFKYIDPDTTYHEVGKFCRLALKCNPTILDLLWLDEYNVRTELGTRLINLRNNFLSAKYVRDAYFGYAASQYGKLSKDPRPEKRAKNARHFARLLHQGWQLYSTGSFSVSLSDPEKFIQFGQAAGAELKPGVAQVLLKGYEKLFESGSVLPENPNPEPINQWLLEVRYANYTKPRNVQQGHLDRDSAEAVEKFKTWP